MGLAVGQNEERNSEIVDKGPLISVIVPVYGTEKYLKRCVNSIQNQSYKNLEIILVDDGSPDDSPRICDLLKAEDERIIVIHKTNGGLSSARNAGLDICHGEYVGFVDSDDFLETDMYAQLFEAISCSKRTIAAAGVVLEAEDGTAKSYINIIKKRELTQDYIKSLLLHRGDVSVCSKLFPREMLGMQRFREGQLNEDMLFMIGLEKNFDGLVYTGTVGYHYIEYVSSLSRSFGKAIHDMVGNAGEVSNYVKQNYPAYTEEAERFEIYQNLAFAWNIPKGYDRKNDALCAQSISFLRKNYLRALRNRFLTGKDKVRLTLVCAMPKLAPFANYIRYQVKK